MTSSHGRSISVLCFPKETYPLERVRLSDLFQREFVGRGHRIIWVVQHRKGKEPADVAGNSYVSIGEFQGGSTIGNMLNRFHRMKKYKKASEVLRTGMIDIVLVNDGIIEGFMGLLLARKYRKPFVFYLSSLFYDMDRKNLRSEVNLKNLWKWMESFPKQASYSYLIAKCDIFHPISDAMGEIYARRTKGKMSYPLPLCPSRPFQNNEVKAIQKTHGPWILIYVGQVSKVRRIEILIDVISELKKRTDESFELRIMGRIMNKGYKAHLLSRSRTLGIEDRVKFIDEGPIEAVPGQIKEADIGLCILPPIKAYVVSSPTKVGEYMSVGIPVIANREIHDQAAIIDRSGGGLLSEYDIGGITNNIIDLVSDANKMHELSSNGSQWIRTNRNYRKMAEKVEGIYLDVLH